MRRIGLPLLVFAFSFSLLAVLLPVLSVLQMKSGLSDMLAEEKRIAVLEHEKLEDRLIATVREAEFRKTGFPLTSEEYKAAAERALPDAGGHALLLIGSGKDSKNRITLSAGLEEAELPETDDTEEHGTRTYTADAGDRTGFFVRSVLFTGLREVEIWSFHGLPPQTKDFRGRAAGNVLASVLVSLILASLISLAVYICMRPVRKIRSALKAGASGDYASRADVRSPSELALLAGDVNRLLRNVEKEKEQLEAISESRKRYSDNMAHEMKTPLTSIMCRADILRIKRKVSEKELRENANVIFEEATRMKNLSSKLLALAETDAAGLSMEPVDAESLFEEIRQAMQPVADGMGVALEFLCEGGTVYADRALFKTMLFNLIENALKASSPGSKVTVSALKEDERIVFYVIDRGIGMSEFDLKHAAEPFYRADKARSRKAGGVGLGLSLCATIAEKHGSKLLIQSEKGAGTVVSVSVPAFVPETEQTDDAEDGETDGSAGNGQTEETDNG